MKKFISPSICCCDLSCLEESVHELERLQRGLSGLDSPFCDAQADLLRWAKTFVQRMGASILY